MVEIEIDPKCILTYLKWDDFDDDLYLEIDCICCDNNIHVDIDKEKAVEIIKILKDAFELTNTP